MTKNMGQGRTDWARELPIRLKLDEMDPRVIPDLTGSADILLGSEQQATLAPTASIFHAGGTPFVFLQSPSGWVKQQVEVGRRNHIYAAIRSGLRPGQVVATQMPSAADNPNPR
jgi:hypothetical protein